MMDTKFQSELAEWLSEQTQSPFDLRRVTAASGGCIHQTYVVESHDWSYFVKCNHASKRDVFEAEADGLRAIARTATIRAPRPIGCGEIGGQSFLAMERLQFGSPGSACYYGDRETDLAFSEFFGGFPAAFYTAYEAAWPLPDGYARRKELYNLYHVLNHANLFGGGYARQAQQMIDALC